jgi:hypothetical protein
LYLGEAISNNRILCFKDNISFFQKFTDMFHVVYYAMICKFVRCGYLVFLF